jgi:hypothetical protein
VLAAFAIAFALAVRFAVCPAFSALAVASALAIGLAVCPALAAFAVTSVLAERPVIAVVGTSLGAAVRPALAVVPVIVSALALSVWTVFAAFSIASSLSVGLVVTAAFASFIIPAFTVVVPVTVVTPSFAVLERNLLSGPELPAFGRIAAILVVFHFFFALRHFND